MHEEEVIARLKFRMRTRRIELGLTQEAIAKRAGISTRRYQEIESEAGTSRNNPTLRTLIAIAKALEIDVADYFK